jgi:hypothetical protein
MFLISNGDTGIVTTAIVVERLSEVAAAKERLAQTLVRMGYRQGEINIAVNPVGAPISTEIGDIKLAASPTVDELLGDTARLVASIVAAGQREESAS